MTFSPILRDHLALVEPQGPRVMGPRCLGPKGLKINTPTVAFSWVKST